MFFFLGWKFIKCLCCDIFLWLFYFLCIVTGQYIVKPPSGNRCRFLLIILSWIAFLLYSLLLNLYSFGFNVFVIWKCPYKYCGYIDVGTNSTLSNNTLYTLSPETPDKFDDFQKFVFSSATFSGMISYVCMMYVLCTHFSVLEGTMNKIKELFNSMWKKFDRAEPDGEVADDPAKVNVHAISILVHILCHRVCLDRTLWE